MKAVILAGGFGTRISEESHLKPKPMIEIGGMPILWHIMKEYAYYGHNEFIICAGYRQEYIKKWFISFENEKDYELDIKTFSSEHPIDAVFEMVCWLLEQGFIKKGGEK